MVPGASVPREISVHTLELVPNTTDQVFVCTNSAQAYITTLQGQVLKRFSSGKQTGAGGDFNCATLSPQGLSYLLRSYTDLLKFASILCATHRSAPF